MEAAEIKSMIATGINSALAQINSGRTPDLAKAYVSFWAEVQSGVGKNANNPHFKNDYADLSACIKAIKPTMVKHGLALLQVPGGVRDGNQQLHNTLIHSSGQSWSFLTELPLGGKATAQSAGSCLTYARRYVIMALAGLAPVDDDGNGASEDDVADDGSAGDNANEVSELTDGMNAFKAKKGEEPKDRIERFKTQFESRVSKTGDDALVKVYLAKRKSLKAA